MNRLKQLLLTGVAAGGMLFSPAGFAAETEVEAKTPVITQTYTQQAMEKAPVLLKGTERDKAELWDLYQKLGQTAEGRKVQASLEEAYQNTGQKIPLRYGFLMPEYGALYQGPLAGITLNRNCKAAVDEVALGHELTHDVQTKRPITESNISFSNLKDAFIAGKLLELETKIQDTVMADEKKMTEQGRGDLFFAFLPLYRDFKKQGKEKFKDDDARVQRYAKTELAKVLWEDQNMPWYQVPLNVFSRNETGTIYKAVGDWNIVYDMQAAMNLKTNGQTVRFQKDASSQADALFNQFAQKIGVDLDATYFRKKMDDGWGISVSENKIKMPGMTMSLNENKQGGLTFSMESGGTRMMENVFDGSGQCLSAKVGGFSADTPLEKEGNVALGLDETHYNSHGQKTKEVTCQGITTTYYPNQQVHEKKDGSGKVLAYFSPDGKALPSEKEFQDGKDGVYYDYDQKGVLIRRTSYQNGQKNGPEIIGKDYCSYKNGQKNGIEHTEQSISGRQIVREVTWENGVKHGDTYRDGKLDGYYHQGQYYWSRDEYEVSLKMQKESLAKETGKTQAAVSSALLQKLGTER